MSTESEDRIQGHSFRVRMVLLISIGLFVAGLSRPGEFLEAQRFVEERSTLPEKLTSSIPAGNRSDPSVLKELPVYSRWTTYTTKDGLPSNKVFCVRDDGNRIWAGTDNGLAVYENGEWRSYSVTDGLPHRAVLSLDISPWTGDLWIGTMGGLARYSAGRFDVFSQLSSGLSNDFVNEVQCDPEGPYVWAATAMGLSRFHVPTETWEIFTHENTPMHEPWTYSVAIDRGLVYVGAWGGGILEFTKALNRWREYRDPDKEMDIDLLPNDGPVHDVTSAVDFESGVLWQGTYMGLARYDGRRWNSFYQEDSGLASNFINFIRARNGIAWLCTDKGLSVTDGVSWITYQSRNRHGKVLFFKKNKLLRTRTFASGPGHNFVLGADFDEAGIWLATEGGVSHGFRTGSWPSEPD